MGNLFTVRQLQDLLQVDRITIYRMLSTGRLKGVKIGGQWRFREEEIQHLLVDRPSDPADQPVPEAILPFPCIQAMQDLFSEAAGVAAVVTDFDGQPLTPYANSCSFCDLILSTEVGARLCAQSLASLAGGRDGPPRLQRCHAGLLCARTIIKLDDRPVAVAVAGQMLPAEEPPDGHLAALRPLAKACAIPLDRLQAAFPSVHRLDRAQTEKMLHLLHTLGVAVCRIGVERQRLVTKLERIAEISTQH